MQFIPKRWPWPEILILLLAAALRLAVLDLKPPHFDEGVNGWFADQMSSTGYYDYNPENYHGPLHMYAVFVSQKLFGHNIVAVRLPAVLASLLAVWLTMRFGRFFGVNASRWAAVAMAVSPACVFYARYSIHESWLLAFLLLTAWGILELWKNGTPAGLYALIGGIAGMVLTKETYFIHIGCFAMAIPCLLAWQLISPSQPEEPLSKRKWTATQAAWAVFLAVFAIVFFYSGTFYNWSGVKGLYEAYTKWNKTGMDSAGGHAKTAYEHARIALFGHAWEFKTYINYYWPALMWRYEWPAFIGLLASVRLLWPAPAHLRYLTIYGGGAMLAYSIIAYKTPWLLLVLLWPFFFVFGAIVDELCKKLAPVPRLAHAPAFLASLCISLSMMWSARLNFMKYDDATEPYVYVQTSREIHRLIDPVFTLVARDPINHQLAGQFFLDSYYPLPWIFNDFPLVSYTKDSQGPAKLTGDFIAAEISKA
ncbi:MAG: flippase activity-associated protein Agl23, partial [Chthoniobacterales bacterium]